MVNRILVGLVFFLCTAFSAEMHKFYVSVTLIEFNQEQKSIQIVSRIFIDDLEDVIQERYDPAIKLQSPEKEKQIDELIKNYLKQKIAIDIDGKEVALNFIGKEYENDLILCYMEIDGIPDFSSIEISNKLLMDVFDQQQNIIHVKKGNSRKSLFLEEINSKGMLKFGE